MKHLSIFLILCLPFFITGCDNTVDEGKTTNTLSSEFSSLEDKVAFLQRYLKPKSTFKKLDFSIVYHDNSTGFVPGPSDWNIGILAIVPPSEIDQWVSGLKKNPDIPKTEWLSRISTTIDYSTINEWYGTDFSTLLGIDREKGLIVYRNVTN